MAQRSLAPDTISRSSYFAGVADFVRGFLSGVGDLATAEGASAGGRLEAAVLSGVVTAEDLALAAGGEAGGCFGGAALAGEGGDDKAGMGIRPLHWGH
jgi:hypothetical protein